MPLSTAEAVRDRAYALIEALAPATDSRTKFRRFRNEEGADFEEWAEQNPTASFRRFQVREDDDDPNPEVSNTTEERVRVRYRISIAYPQTHRYGAQNAMDRHDVMNQDYVKIRHAIGIDGRANFTTSDAGSYDATPLGATKTREQGGKVDYLIVIAEFEFVRSTVLTTTLSAVLSDSDDPLTANGGAFTYTLVVTNTGMLPATSIRAVVTLPSGVGYTSATGTGWTITNSGQLVSCAMASGQPGALATITITCTAPNDVGDGSMTASVSVSADNVITAASASQVTTLAATDVFLIAGQSNAEGMGSASLLSDPSYADPYAPIPIIMQATRADDPPTWRYYDGSTIHASAGTANPTSTYGDVGPHEFPGWGVDNFGPECSLARQFVTDGTAIDRLAKFTLQGSSLSTQWLNAAYPTGGPTSLRDQFFAFVTAAGVIAGAYWNQGEDDADTSAEANAYSSNMTTLWDDFFSRFPACPLIIGKLNALASGATYPFRDTVRSQQIDFVQGYPWTTLVDCDDLALGADSIHYTADSQVIIGQRVAAAFAAALLTTTLSATLTDDTGGSLVADGATAFAYILTVTNGGARAASNVSARVTLPAGVGYVSAIGTGWTISQSGQVVTCTRASAAVGAQPAITINCTAPASAGSGSMTAQAKVVSSNVSTATTASDATNLTAPSYTIDATAGVPLPQTAAEWTAFIAAMSLAANGWSTPDLLHTLQGNASPLVPAIGTAQLAATGTVTYQQALTGFATMGVRFDQTAMNYLSSTDASLPDLSSTSALVLALIDAQLLNPGVGQFPNLFGMVSATGFTAEMYQNSLHWYVRNNGNLAQSANQFTARGVVPVIISHNVTALSIAGYSDQDKLLPAYLAVAATKLLTLGNNTAYTATGGFGCNYLAAWWGANAERSAADVKALLTAMNYAPPWT